MASGNPSMGRWGLAVALSLAFVGAAMPAAADAARPPLGRYTCVYPPFFTPHPLKLVSDTKYKIDGGGKSRYAFVNKKVNFRRGAYKDFYGRYEGKENRIVIYDKETDARLWNCDRGR